MRLDALIFGGGAAGLWLLDRLSRDGHHVLLLEGDALGTGQTISSHGIIHSNFKCSLSGLLTKSAKSARDVPQIWREALRGEASPNLSQTKLRSDCCYVWNTPKLVTRLGLVGTESDSRVSEEIVSVSEYPEALRGVTGTVTRVCEQIIAPQTFVQDLAEQYHDRILKIDAKHGLEFDLDSPGQVTGVKLTSPHGHDTLELRPRQVIFAAGKGNVRLRRLIGLSTEVMQRRTMHIILVRGNLPAFNGHCLEGTKKRITITSETDSDGRVVWQVGGQIAEEGVKFDAISLTERAKTELSAALPNVDFRAAEWSTYTVDRAEGATEGGSRPDSIQVLCAGNVTTGWPTQLVLAPILAHEIASRASSPYFATEFDTSPFADWPRPDVATLPWAERARSWWKLEERAKQHRRAA